MHICITGESAVEYVIYISTSNIWEKKVVHLRLLKVESDKFKLEYLVEFKFSMILLNSFDQQTPLFESFKVIVIHFLRTLYIQISKSSYNGRIKILIKVYVTNIVLLF